MTSPPITPEAAEKIRKAQWTKENTAKTQKVVNNLLILNGAIVMLFGDGSNVSRSLNQAIKRFMELDKGVELPK